jgi:hypothetical protein
VSGSPDPDEAREWARENRAAWELSPFVQMHQGQPVQVGYTLTLYARVPTEIPPSRERREAVLATWDRLRGIADALVAQEPEGTDIEVDAYDAEERFRRENGFRSEVTLYARIVHEKDYFAPVEAGDRERLRPLEERLRALGLRRDHW